MTRQQAIMELQLLDIAYKGYFEEAQFWANEIRLSKTASPYVKASERPVLEARYQKARDEQEVTWQNMVKLMEQYNIGPDDM